MTFMSKLTGWFNRDGQAQNSGQARTEGKSDLKANMEKALAMKQAAGPQTNIPEHQTARDGEIKGPQMGMTDRDAGSQGSHQPQLKRSQVARSGDT
jgi:hypothetical protein